MKTQAVHIDSKSTRPLAMTPSSLGARCLQRIAAAWLPLTAMLVLGVLCASPVSAQGGLRIEQWTTGSGARVLFVPSPSIPMFDVNVDFDAGSRFDPAQKAGLASMTVALMAKGIVPANGKAMNESDIAEAYAAIGALRGGGASDDRASVSLRTLTSQTELDAAVELTANILAYPDFPDSVVRREKERVLSSLKEAESKPETIVSRTFNQLVFGKHPYGVDASSASIAAINRQDMQRFHREFFRADRATVAMIGAVSRAQAEAIAERLTRQLPNLGNPSPKREFDAIVRPLKPVDRRIEHPASQSHILIGAPAIARGDPDFFPLLVGNYVLGGGGFVSRLYNEVREQRGLAYSVYSGFSPALDTGAFTIGLQTQREKTAESLSVVFDTLQKFLQNGPTDVELASAKSNMVGGFPLRIDSNRKILDNLALIGFYRLPIDYLDTWASKVEAVTLDSVRAAFARHVAIDRLITVVVGAGS